MPGWCRGPVPPRNHSCLARAREGPHSLPSLPPPGSAAGLTPRSRRPERRECRSALVHGPRDDARVAIRFLGITPGSAHEARPFWPAHQPSGRTAPQPLTFPEPQILDLELQTTLPSTFPGLHVLTEESCTLGLRLRGQPARVLSAAASPAPGAVQSRALGCPAVPRNLEAPSNA